MEDDGYINWVVDRGFRGDGPDIFSNDYWNAYRDLWVRGKKKKKTKRERSSLKKESTFQDPALRSSGVVDQDFSI